ncbi:ankyrin repeat domain-containing protein, partial [Maricaulis sp. D1M11]|uniref:ankyrin repeat domain-containing protein n=1 Tax=Maricaulis sp. D1M11 TaxID=3076117 RepID=UPI0039B6E451
MVDVATLLEQVPNARELAQSRLLSRLPRSEAVALPLLFNATTTVDFGVTAGVYLAIKAGDSLLDRNAALKGVDVSHAHGLHALVYEAKWRSLLHIAKQLDRSGQSFGQNSTLRAIKELAEDKILNPPTDFASEADAPKGFIGKVREALGLADAVQHEFSEREVRLLQHLGGVLSAPPGEHGASASKDAFDQFKACMADQLIDEIVEELRAIPATRRLSGTDQFGGAAFIKALRDKAKGWSVVFSRYLSALLTDSKNDHNAKLVLLRYAAESYQRTVAIEAMIVDLVDEVSRGRTQTLDALGEVSSQLAGLKNLLAPPLRLHRSGRPPSVSSYDGPEPAYFIQLAYTAERSEFTGREDVLDQLDVFTHGNQTADGLPTDQKFMWWQISGDAGHGKSRLALQWVRECLARNWQAGFLNAADLSADRVDWMQLDFPRPTLIVIDYVSSQEKATGVSKLLEALSIRDRENTLGTTIRVLLIDRSAYRRDRAEQGGSSQAVWYQELRKKSSDVQTLEGHCFNPRSALALPPLALEELVAIAQSWRESQGQNQLSEPQIDDLRDHLSRPVGQGGQARDRAKRPLLAMIFADVVAEDGSRGERSLAAMIRLALDMEVERQWPVQGLAEIPVEAVRLANLALLTGEVDLAVPRIQTALLDAENDCFGLRARYNDTLHHAWMVLGRDVATPTPAAAWPPVMAREPDLVGELAFFYFYRQCVGGRPLDMARDVGPILDMGWRVNFGATADFLARLSEDATDLELDGEYDQLVALLPEGQAQLVTYLAGKSTEDLASDLIRFAAIGLSGWISRIRAALDDLNPQLSMRESRRALLAASATGQVVTVRTLLAEFDEREREATARFVDPDTGVFPLLMAAQEGHVEVVMALLAALPEDERSEAVRQCHEDGGFPLLQAAQNGHVEVVERLLAALSDAERGEAVRQVDMQSG